MGHLSVVAHLHRPSRSNRSPDRIERLTSEMAEHAIKSEIEVRSVDLPTHSQPACSEVSSDLSRLASESPFEFVEWQIAER